MNIVTSSWSQMRTSLCRAVLKSGSVDGKCMTLRSVGATKTVFITFSLLFTAAAVRKTDKLLLYSSLFTNVAHCTWWYCSSCDSSALRTAEIFFFLKQQQQHFTNGFYFNSVGNTRKHTSQIQESFFVHQLSFKLWFTSGILALALNSLSCRNFKSILLYL